MLPVSKAVICVVALIASCEPLYATTVFIVVVKDNIVIAADTKESWGKDHGESFNSAHKIVILNERSVVAEFGTVEMHFAPPGQTPFHFNGEHLVADIKRSISPNADVLSIEKIVIEKFKTAMDGFSPYVEKGLFNKENAPDSSVIFELVFAGYVNGVPTVNSIAVSCDWDQRKVIGPVALPYHLSQGKSHVLCFGVCDAVHRLNDPSSLESATAHMRYHAALTVPNDLSGAIVTASEHIRLESEFNPELVGPPIDVVVLSPTSAPVLTTLP